MIEMEVVNVGQTPGTDQCHVVLKEKWGGERYLPMSIGVAEAQAIAAGANGIVPTRPLSHQLIRDVVSQLGARISYVVVDRFDNNTYFATISVEIQGITREIDARPSDAFAVAIWAKTSIYVEAEILAQCARIPDSQGFLRQVPPEPSTPIPSAFKGFIEGELDLEDFDGKRG
jgi:bifunctional DNase/RNase